MERVLLIGYYGWNNTGDDIMLQSILKILSKSVSDHEIVVLSQESSFHTLSLKNVRTVSPKKKVKFIKELLDSSTVILGGGTHLYDYGRLDNRLIRLSQLLLIFLIARSLSKKVIFMGVGVEPPQSVWGRLIIRAICNLANCISVRDEDSYDTLIKMGVGTNIVKSFDLSVLSDLPERDLRENNGGKILGVSVLPYYSIYFRDSKSDNELLVQFSKAIDIWLNDDEKNTVRLMVFKADYVYDDHFFSSALRELLGHDDRVELIPYDKDPIMTFRKIQECDAFIGMRYHSCILAYLSSIPQLIISYARKNTALANDIGLNPLALILVDSVKESGLESVMKELIERPDDFRATLPLDVAKTRALASIDCLGGGGS